MTRALLVALVLCAGCVDSTSIFSPPEASNDCASVPAYARNPATGECVKFTSRCDVPAEWAACMPFQPCSLDTDCLTTQHCEAQPTAPGSDVTVRACAANPSCGSMTACADGYTCSFDASGAGTCSRGDAGPNNPPPPPPPPTVATCQATSECGPLQVCPAQYGGCSASSPDANDCPSHCEKACTADRDCADPATQRCNAADVCAMSTNDPSGNPGLACAGWCVPR